MIYVHGVKSEDPIIVKDKTVNPEENNQKDDKTVVVPVGKKQKKEAEDIDKLPQGFCVEKTSQETEPQQTEASKSAEQQPDDDDDDLDLPPNTDLDTNKLETGVGIALSQTDPIDEAIEASSIRGVNATFGIENQLDKAQTLVKDDQNAPLREDFKKGVHGVSVIRAEKLNYKVDMFSFKGDRDTETLRADQILTYKSKSERTKLMFTGTFTQTDKRYKIVSEDIQPEIAEDTDIPNSKTATESENTEQTNTTEEKSFQRFRNYGMYLGLNQKIGKNDEIYASIVHTKGGSNLDNLKTTSIEGEYVSNKYNFTIDGDVIITDIGSESSVKSNLSFRFNTKEDEAAEEEVKQEETPVEENKTETEEKTENYTIPQDTKKWKKKGGVIIKYEDIDGVGEKGIGYYYDNKKKTSSTNTKFTMFAMASITQRKEEKDSYYATAGAEFKYRNQINNDTKFQADANIINKYSFSGPDKGNMTTTQFTAKITNSKVNAEVKGKGILLPDTQYAGVTAKISYKPIEKVQGLEVFTRGEYVYEKTELHKTQGGSILAGISYSF